MHHIGLITARGYKRHIERVGDVARLHGRAQLPAYDVA